MLTLDDFLEKRLVDESRCCNQWYAIFGSIDGSYQHIVDYTNCEHANNPEYYRDDNRFKQQCVIPGDLIYETYTTREAFFQDYGYKECTVHENICE